MQIINPYRYAGFTPPDIAGLELWYDQSDISTLWTDDGTTQVSSAGDLVYRWDDKSGNGGHVKQTTSGNRPTYQTTGISFDGADWLEQSTKLPQQTPSTSFSVFSTSSSSSQVFWSIVKPSSSAQMIGTYISGGIVRCFKYYSTFQFASTSASTYADGAKHICTGMETATNDREVWVDGGDNGANTTNVADVSATLFVLGALRDSTPGSYLTGYLHEVIIYDSALSTADRQAVEAYLTNKWGL